LQNTTGWLLSKTQSTHEINYITPKTIDLPEKLTDPKLAQKFITTILILNQINSLNTHTLYFFKVYYNINLPSLA